jgi:hypothetical protein
MNKEEAMQKLSDCIISQMTEEQFADLKYCVENGIEITAKISDELNDDGTVTMTIEYDETLINRGNANV